MIISMIRVIVTLKVTRGTKWGSLALTVSDSKRDDGAFLDFDYQTDRQLVRPDWLQNRTDLHHLYLYSADSYNITYTLTFRC